MREKIGALKDHTDIAALPRDVALTIFDERIVPLAIADQGAIDPETPVFVFAG